MNRTEVSHFFLGRVTDTSRFSKFLEEHYGEDDDLPISEFYGSQGEIFCDHDFMEVGRRGPVGTLEDFFKPYSYSDHWSASVCQAAHLHNMQDANALIFITSTEIKSPRSVKYDGFELVYLGAFEYPI